MDELYKLVQELAEKVGFLEGKVDYLENQNKMLKNELNIVSLYAKTGCPVLSEEERKDSCFAVQEHINNEKQREELKGFFK